MVQIHPAPRLKFNLMTKIQEILTNRQYPAAGEILFNELKTAIDNNDIIDIDFNGVTSVPPTFLNCSFGHLIDIYGVDKVKQSVRFINITKQEAENIKEYFSIYGNKTNG